MSEGPDPGPLGRPPRGGRFALRLAAVAFTVIGLAGPALLAAGVDPRPYAWVIAPLWLVVIGALAWRFRGRRRR